MVNHVLIIGATSTIAEATARILAQRGDRLYLLARNRERLSSLAEDLQIRGAASVDYDRLDVNDVDTHADAIDTAFTTLGTVDTALVAHGTLPDQKACETDPEAALAALSTNAISTVLFLTHLTNCLLYTSPSPRDS